MGYLPVGRSIDRIIGSSIRKIMLKKGLFLVVFPLGFNWGIVTIQIDTTI